MGKGDGTCGQRSAMTLETPGGGIPDLTRLEPAGVDELWAKEREPLYKLEERAASLRKTIRKYRKFNMSPASYEESLERVTEQIQAEVQRLQPFEDEWDRRGGWSRAYLVQNHDGHVHKHTYCSTLRATTMISWLPQLSGSTEEQIIGEVGHMACTVCYPDAPTHPAFIKSAKEAEAEEAKKAQGKCPASGTYAPEGSYDPRLYSPYARCPECGEGVSVTRTGKLRQHKRKQS